jgi:outer membrane beta-barrel protein
MKALLLIGLLLAFTAPVFAAEETPSLEEQLRALELPSNQAPAGLTKERLYVIQERYLPLRLKLELSVGAALNVSGNSFLNTQQVEGGLRFHLNDRWSLGLTYAMVSNKFTAAADRLLDTEGIIPDLAYAKSRSDATIGYNVFYGKLRLSADQVFYFDQYVALGAGIMQLSRGNSTAAVADAGFAFWLGKWGSARIGVKDYYYNEPKRSGNEMTHNLHPHLDIGYLF